MANSVNELDRQKKKHIGMTRFFRVILALPKAKKMRLNHEQKILPEGGNLILANHVTRDDFLFINCLFKNHIYYVVGENVLRKPIAKWFLTNYFGVVTHMRGASSLNTIKQMFRLLNNNCNVCIFPEGSMTFDGRTKPVGPAIAKVAKKSGANLVLCKIEGGYFAQPRWGITSRKGQMSISDHIICSEEMKKLSVEELSDIINEKLFTDAYEEQKKNPIAYIGSKKCKGLECCIYECPECRQISRLKSRENSIYCECGFEAEYDEYGYLTDKAGNQYSVRECCDNQKESLRSKVEAAKLSENGVFLFEDEFECLKINLNEKPYSIGKCRIKAYSNRIECCINGENREIKFADIEGVYVVLRNMLDVNMAATNDVYELRGDFFHNVLKYKDLFDIVKEEENYGFF